MISTIMNRHQVVKRSDSVKLKTSRRICGAPRPKSNLIGAKALPEESLASAPANALREGSVKSLLMCFNGQARNG